MFTNSTTRLSTNLHTLTSMNKYVIMSHHSKNGDYIMILKIQTYATLLVKRLTTTWFALRQTPTQKLASPTGITTRAKAVCVDCNSTYDIRRFYLGILLCPDCGEEAARQVTHCTVPLHKGNYTVITRKSDLLHLNQKPIC